MKIRIDKTYLEGEITFWDCTITDDHDLENPWPHIQASENMTQVDINSLLAQQIADFKIYIGTKTLVDSIIGVNFDETELKNG